MFCHQRGTAITAVATRVVSALAYLSLHCALSLAAQCIVSGPVCRFVCLFVCLWVCYHDNSKLRVSIFTKFSPSVGEGSDYPQLIKFWPSYYAPPGRCLRRGENFWFRLTTAVFASLWALFFVAFVSAAAQLQTQQMRWGWLRDVWTGFGNQETAVLLVVLIWTINLLNVSSVIFKL